MYETILAFFGIFTKMGSSRNTGSTDRNLTVADEAEDTTTTGTSGALFTTGLMINPITGLPITVAPVVTPTSVADPIDPTPAVSTPSTNKSVAQDQTDAILINPITGQPISSEVPAEPVVVETPKVTEPTVEEAPAVEAPVVETPVEEEPVIVVAPVVEEDPVTEPVVVEDIVVEDPVAEEDVPVVEEVVSEPPVEENTVVEDVVAEDPVEEEDVPIVEEAVVENTVTEPPVEEDVVVEETIVEDPVAEDPVIEVPVEEEPIVEAPVEDAAPVVVAPVVEEIPVAEPVVVEEVVVEDPVEETEAPVTEVLINPITGEPIERDDAPQTPVVEPVVVEAPVEEAEAPVTEVLINPITGEPIERDDAPQTPVVEPVEDEAPAEETPVAEPVEEPIVVVRDYVVVAPVVEEQPVVVQQPIVNEPVVVEPEVVEPVVQEPEVVEEIVVEPVFVVEEQAPVAAEDPAPQPVVEEQAEEQPAPAPVQDAEPTVTEPEPDPEPVEDVLEPALPPTPSNASTDGPERLEATEFDTDAAVSIDGGRVTTLQMENPELISAIEIVSGPEHGNATVNPDNSIAMVLSGSDYSGDLSMDFKVTYTDGTTSLETLNMDVSAPQQESGWGLGQHYMLEEDADGELVIETGDTHRKVFVSESDTALTKADIAAMEDLRIADIDDDWLIDNPQYGGSEAMAVSTDVGMELWFGLTNNQVSDNGGTSHWLLFERGYTYDDVENIAARGMMGESELQPLHITAWGEGDRPVIDSTIRLLNEDTGNIVFSELEFTEGMLSLTGDNVILDDVHFTETLLNIQYSDQFTLHDSEISHVVLETPEDQAFWSGHTSGMFAKNSDGLLIEGSIFHHNAWEDDYRYDYSTEGGMPPNMLSHNIYIQNNTTDVTLRDNIIAQGASFGAHVRGGGYIEDNLFLDNNNAVDFLGGKYVDDGYIGNFTLFTDNVITSAGYKETALNDGGLSRGVTNDGLQTTMLDNLVVHLANPDDPDELAEKEITHFATNSEDGSVVYDDTVIYNWVGSNSSRIEIRGDNVSKNTENVDPDQADETTIQNYAALLTGNPDATIADLMDYLLSLPDSAYDDAVTADDIIAYFQTGFGLEGNGAESQKDHRFIPNDLGDGVRWDNRINWDTEDVPDTYDTVNLAGNSVQYGGTVKLLDLDLGNGGHLTASHGRLDVIRDFEAGVQGGEITTQGSGQIWVSGYDGDGRLDINVDGGRFVNSGELTGQTSMHVTDGQAILAARWDSYTVSDGSELRISGSEARVGFDTDNTGVSTLKMTEDAILSFVADENGFSTIEEFRSGAFGDSVNNFSGALLDGTLQLDLSDYAAGAGRHDLVDTDALDGVFDDIHVHGLSSAWDAKIVTDYDEDVLFLEISKGTGTVDYASVGSVGNSSGENATLWTALTDGQGTYDESLPILHDENDEEISEILG